jgi:hypothetical protein
MLLGLLALLVLAAGCKSTGTPAYLQGMLGANAVSGNEITYKREPPDFEGEADMGAAPMIMGIGQAPLVGNKDVNAGVEIGGSLTWWFSGLDMRTVYFGPGGGIFTFNVENQMWLAELFAGPYVSFLIAERVRLFGAAGAGFTWSYLDWEREVRDFEGIPITRKDSDSEFGIGFYGRAGIEYQFAKDMYFGVGARYLVTEFDYKNLGAKVELGMWQALASFTVGF